MEQVKMFIFWTISAADNETVINEWLLKMSDKIEIARTTQSGDINNGIVITIFYKMK